MRLLLLTCVIAVVYGSSPDYIIDYVNNVAKTTWKAGHNSFHGYDEKDIIKSLGALDDPLFHTLPVKRQAIPSDIPENFDPRQKWPKCKCIDEVRDQGACGSCWAFGAVSALTDRICIASGGSKTPRISAEDPLSCCRTCGFGCNGGWLSPTWQYFQRTGVVTGGAHASKQGCRPYTLQPCHHGGTPPGPRPNCKDLKEVTPACKLQCIPEHGTGYNEDKVYTSSTFSIRGVASLQTELMTNGPVEAAFTVYQDFLTYKSGVYQHVTGRRLGGHAIKLIGWGVENGTPYWMCSNSWNTDWGDKGYFKILRGSNHCGIEGNLVAGAAKV